MRTNKKISQPTKSVFSFVVDGNCEYWYLQMLKRNERSLKIHLLPEFYNKKTLEEQYKRVLELAKVSEKVFWILLHFCHTNRFYESYKTLLPDLQKHLASYEKTEKYFVKSTPDIYKRLKPKLQMAISNSEKLGEINFDKIQTGIAEMYKIFKTLEL